MSVVSQVGVRLGCPRQRAKGQRLGSPQDKCPLRAKRVSSGRSPAEASQGRDKVSRCVPRWRVAGVPCRQGGQLTTMHLGWRLMSGEPCCCGSHEQGVGDVKFRDSISVAKDQGVVRQFGWTIFVCKVSGNGVCADQGCCWRR